MTDTNDTDSGSEQVDDVTEAAALVPESTPKVVGEIGDTDATGVVGETQSSSTDAAGVQGNAVDGDIGVEGRSYDTESNLPSLTSIESAGVIGKSDESSGYGVVGWSKNYDGVFGRTDDPGESGGSFYRRSRASASGSPEDVVFRDDERATLSRTT